MVNVPINHTTNTTGYDPDIGIVGTHGGNYTLKTTTQNRSVLSIGLSGGISVKLSKHLFYELSLSYYYNNQSSKIIQIQNYVSGTPDSYNYTTSINSTHNYMGLGNGISYRCNKFSFTHTILLYQYIDYKQSTVYAQQGYSGNATQSYLTFGNVAKDGLHIALMSEHKVGYSFLNGRIVPCIGVNINWSSSFNTNNFYGKTQFKPVWLPFASVKINF